MTDQQYNEKLFQRLFKDCIKVINKNYEKPCLERKVYSDKDGYSQISVKGKQKRAHRVSYALYNNINVDNISKINEKGDKLVVCHGYGCKKNCIEPSHLSLKTLQENNYNDKERDNTLLIGNKNPNSKITESIALAIKHSKGTMSVKKRSETFKIKKSIIYKIDAGYSWVHLPDKNGLINTSIKVREQDQKRRKINKNRLLNDEDFKKILDTIKKKITINEGQCHIYNCAINKSGYGSIKYRGITYRTHVIVFRAYHRISENKNMLLRHICNVKCCCNPLHLKEGTNKENSLDMLCYSKRCKLNVDDVKKIKILIEKKMNLKDIAKMFSVSPASISGIKNGKRWSHV
jgi:hypothetical protein